MLQQRASKYHSLCWTNTCCSHQRDGEKYFKQEAEDYLKKWVLKRNSKSFSILFTKPLFDNGLTEHELDHVMIGYYDDAPIINRGGSRKWIKEK
jgi:isopentenyl-diphosphate delta-isomerase